MKKVLNEAARIVMMAIPIVILTCISAFVIHPSDPLSTAFLLFLMSIYTLLETTFVQGPLKRRDPFFLVFISVVALWMYQTLCLVKEASMPGGLTMGFLSGFFINTLLCTVLLVIFDAVVLFVVFEASRRFRRPLFF